MDSGEPGTGTEVPEHATATDHSPSASNLAPRQIIEVVFGTENVGQCMQVLSSGLRSPAAGDMAIHDRRLCGRESKAMRCCIMANVPRAAGLLLVPIQKSPWRARAMHREKAGSTRHIG